MKVKSIEVSVSTYSTVNSLSHINHQQTSTYNNEVATVQQWSTVDGQYDQA